MSRIRQWYAGLSSDRLGVNMGLNVFIGFMAMIVLTALQMNRLLTTGSMLYTIISTIVLLALEIAKHNDELEVAHLLKVIQYNRFWRLVAGEKVEGGIAADDSPESIFAQKIAGYLRAGDGKCFYAEVNPRARGRLLICPFMDASGINRVANYLFGYIHYGAIAFDPIPGIHKSCGQQIYDGQAFAVNFIRTLATYAQGGLPAVLLPTDDQTLLRAAEPTTDTLLKPADTTYQIPEEQLLHVTAGE